MLKTNSTVLGNRKKIIVGIGALLIVIISVLCIWVAIGSNNKSEIRYLTISTLPEKTEYYQGESFSYYGIEIIATMNSGTEITIAPESCDFVGFDSSSPMDVQKITVSYQGADTSFNVKIKAFSSGSNESFNGMSFKTLPKTEYKVGEWLSVEGGVLILHYENGTEKEIALEIADVSGFTSMEAGTYELTVRHIEDGFLATCTYTITVTE